MHTKIKILYISFLFLINIVSANQITVYQDSNYIIKSDTMINKNEKEVIKTIDLFKKKIMMWAEDSMVEEYSIKDSVKYPQNIRCIKRNSELHYSGIPGSCDFIDGELKSFTKKIKTRYATYDEREYFNKNNKISPAYCNISESKAIKIANEFLKKILNEYGKNENINDFDRINLVHGGVGDRFVISFKCSIKKDIKDLRDVEIGVVPFNGEICHLFAKHLISPYDLNYQPKITKEGVLSKINAYFKELGIKAKYDLFLSQSGNSKNRWAWHLYGVKENSKQRIKDCVIIDSETGEFIISTFGPINK